VTELTKDHEELLIQQADAAGPLLLRKAADLHEVIQKKPLDRAAANALLRQLFSGIVVDYTGPTRFLRLHWKQGGESVVTYGMEPAK